MRLLPVLVMVGCAVGPMEDAAVQAELEGQLFERDVTLTATEAARDHFAEEGYKPEFGAREMGRVIQEKGKRTLADLILFGDLRHGRTAEVDFVDSEVVVRAKKNKKPQPEPEEKEPADA